MNAEKIGNYCDINSGVVVGSKNSVNERPSIGDHVSLSVGCKVIGKINLGNHSVVAPNSVVIKDVLDYHVVSGVPAGVIKINKPEI